MNKKAVDKAKEINYLEEVFIKGQDYKDVKSKKSIWEKLAQLFDGKLKVKHTVSKVFYTLTLEIPYKNQTITLIETDTKPLKLNVEFNLNRNFEFNLSWEDSTDRIMKVFGKQDITIGDEQFDKKYLIQSNENELSKIFFGHKELKESMLRNNIYVLSLDFIESTGVTNLLTVKDRNTKDINSLIELVKLQFMLIDRFIEMKLLKSEKSSGYINS